VKKFWLLITMAVVILSLVTGCTAGGEIKAYTDSGRELSVKANQEFMIALGANPTTGYDWEASYDESLLRLVRKQYEPGKEAKEGLVGAGGVDYFRFKALKTGKTQITMDYKRSWEEQSIEQKVFTVNIVE